MRRREVALGILVAAVEDAAPAAFPGHALDQFAGLALRTLDAERLRTDELALRVSGAADELAVLAVLLDQLRAALGAFFVEQLIGLVGAARASHQAARRLAFRIPGAGQEGSPAAALDHHFSPAVIAIFGLRLPVLILAGQFRGEVANEVAIGIA